MTLLGSCTETLDLNNLFDFLCCMVIFDAKILLLLRVVNLHMNLHEQSQYLLSAFINESKITKRNTFLFLINNL